MTAIASITGPGRATVEGRVHSVEIRPVERSCVLACVVADATGELTALFYGRTHIAGVVPGVKDAGSAARSGSRTAARS